jgi:hypothetical protein
VATGVHKRHVNGILGLLCRLHFLGLIEFGGKQEPAYTFDHYVAFPNLPDQFCRQFTNKAVWVMAELWVSLSRTTLLNTSHSLDILEIMTGYIMSVCRISSYVSRDLRLGRLVWLRKPIINS